jgi:hypothetical protein
MTSTLNKQKMMPERVSALLCGLLLLSSGVRRGGMKHLFASLEVSLGSYLIFRELDYYFNQVQRKRYLLKLQEDATLTELGY